MFLGMSFALPAHYLSEYRHKKAETDPATAAELAKENKVHLVHAARHPVALRPARHLPDGFGLLHINASIWMLLRGGGATRAMFSARCSARAARRAIRRRPPHARTGIVFVAIMKHFALKDRPSRARRKVSTPWRLTRTATSAPPSTTGTWLGVGGITVAVILVGLSSQIGVDASTTRRRRSTPPTPSSASCSRWRAPSCSRCR